MADKRNIRSRLESMREIVGVLPTARGDGYRSAALTSIAEDLHTGKLGKAALESTRDLGDLMADEHYTGSAITELAASEILTDQVAQFARAGFNFFRSSPEYRKRPLNDRREVGGNGEVRRVMRSEHTLVLETPRLIIGFAPDVSDNLKKEVFKRHRLIHIRHLGFAAADHCASPEAPTLESCLSLMNESTIEYAEPDFIEVIPERFSPNDPDFAVQWHHTIIENPAAWDLVTGDPVRLAVIDNGFDVGHPDLNMNPALSGWYRPTPNNDDADFIAGLQSMPNGNHGTACAGMAAAIGDNANGGAGVAYNATLFVVACLNDQVGTQLTLARALAYAADPSLETGAQTPGADVISCSLGPNSAHWEIRRVLYDAIDFVTANGRNGMGTPVFWASTNGNYPISADEVCSHPQTIVVGRSTENDTDDGSGFGPELDFLAPGVDVWIPASGGGYRHTTGTSFAAPCAAGVAALLLARNGSLTAQDVRLTMRNKADKVGNLPYTSGRNDRFGYGRINSLRTVT